MANQPDNIDMPSQMSLHYFADSTSKRTLAQVLEPALQDEFKPLANFNLSAGYSSAAYWLRLTLDTRSQPLITQPVGRLLGFANPLIQHIHCYQRVVGTAQLTDLGQTGSMTPISQRPVVSASYYIPLSVQPAQLQQVFCRIQSVTSLSVPVVLLTEQQARVRQQYQHLWFGFVGGLLILLIALNLFVALVTRIRANALYAANLTSLLVLFCAVTGVGPTYIWPAWTAQLSWVVPLSLHGITLTSYLFCMSFFKQQSFVSWQQIWLPRFVWLTLFLLAVSLLQPYAVATQIAMYNALLMIFVLSGAAMMACRQQLDGAWLFLAGRLLLMSGGLIQFGKTQGFIPAFELIEHVLFLAAIAEGLLLSVGLAMQNRRLELEKHQVARQVLASSQQSLQAQTALNERLTAEIAERRQSEQVQKVLFQISEWSVDNGELGIFLQKIHHAVSTLLFANNFYVALYDRQQDAVRFPYMVDEVDAVLPAPDEYIAAGRLQGSWTMWILQHGQPLFGDAPQITAKTGLAPRFGAVARCWLGLPLFNSAGDTVQEDGRHPGDVFGVLCLQIYDDRPFYSDSEYRLLEYVSRHISQALLRRQYRADLEATVAERTTAYRLSVEQLSALNHQLALADLQSKHQLNQIKNLLDNTGQGFLSCDQSLTIQPEYSQECCAIFQQAQISGDLSCLLAGGDAALQQLYREVLSEVLNSELPDGMSQVYLSLLPQQQQYFSQFYQLEYKKIGQNMMLVILSNITETRSLQQALQQQQQDAAFVVYSLTHETEVRQTLLAFDAFLQQQQRVSAQWDAEADSRLFRELHTFKGLLAQIQCPQLPADIHQAEERLLQLRQQGTSSDDSTRLTILAALRERFDQVCALLCEHLGAHFLQTEPQLKVPASLLQQICQVLNRSQPDLVLKLRQTEFKPLTDLLAGHLNAAKRLALSQQKELAVQLQLDVPLWLDGDWYQQLFAVLVHLFRNSVDHGCELPGVRLAQGKPAVATLTVTAQLTEEGVRDSMPGHVSVASERSAPAASLLLSIRDDGQGIALDGIREQIVQRGLLSAAEAAALNEPALLNYIFADQFSTKQDASEISGRGVGLAAVRQVLQQYGGQISVSTESGQGSCFVLTIPLQAGHYLSQASRLSESAESSAFG
jgi:signal transduction histidine kinase